jgi:hypothetical protein
MAVMLMIFVQGCGKETVSAGNGLSGLKDPKLAATEAAMEAKAALGSKEAKVVLVFDSLKKNVEVKEQLLEGIGSVFDLSLVYGCSSYSPLTQKDNKGTVGVLAIGGDIQVATAVANLDKGFEQCGRQIAESIEKSGISERKGQVMLLFGSCHVPSNDKLVNGVKEVLGENFPIVGGAASSGEHVYYQGKIVPKSNVGILLAGDFKCSFSTKKDNSPEGLISSAGDAFEEAIGPNKDNVIMTFAFDCGGRRGKMGDNLPKELVAMKKVAGESPIFGFYGSGEIGPEDNNSPTKGVGYHLAVCSIKSK